MFTLGIHHYIEIIALLTSIICWRKIKDSSLRWFVPYLVFIVFTELYGKYLASIKHSSNAWLYNLSVPVEYLFFGLLIWSGLKKHLFKETVFILLILFFIYVCYVLILGNGITVFNAGFLQVGSGLMVLFSCLFFWELFERPTEVSLLRYPMFWIVAGLFLFNLGEFSYNLFANLLFKNGDRAAVFFRQINNYLNLVLYICISIGLICRKPSAETSV